MRLDDIFLISETAAVKVRALFTVITVAVIVITIIITSSQSWYTSVDAG